MSEFAKLLGNLQNSATKVEDDTKDNTSQRHNVENETNRKRIYPPPQTNDERKPRRPRWHNHNDHTESDFKLHFLCLGAQKSGTTWLHRALLKCCEGSIALPTQKEVHFWDWNRPKGLKWYSQQFPSPSAKNERGLIYGEINPCYAVLSEHDIREIKELWPDLKLFFIARDPLERAWSALRSELQAAVQGLDAGTFHSTNDPAANPELQNDEYFLERLAHSTHAHRSDYAGALRRWLDCGFTPSSLLLVSYEALCNEPTTVLRQICGHIGIHIKDKEDFQSKLPNRANVTAGVSYIRPSLKRKMMEMLRPSAKDFNVLLKELGYEWTVDEYEYLGKK